MPYGNTQAERDPRMMKVRGKIRGTERDPRMMKVRGKIRGTFRSGDHAQVFCGIRSVISCARKQSRGILATLRKLAVSPRSLGDEFAKADGT